jgi:hypothetical protein
MKALAPGPRRRASPTLPRTLKPTAIVCRIPRPRTKRQRFRCSVPTFAQDAECCLIGVRDALLKLGHDRKSALVVLINRTLAKRTFLVR